MLQGGDSSAIELLLTSIYKSLCQLDVVVENSFIQDPICESFVFNSLNDVKRGDGAWGEVVIEFVKGC